MGFLPEAIADSNKTALSPFAECVVLATLHGRSMSHRRLAQSGAVSNKEAHEFWTRHGWLTSVVEERLQRESRASAASPGLLDGNSMLTFTHLLAHDTIICLSDTAKGIAWKEVDHQLMAMTYEHRACEAASDMVRLAKAVPQPSCFEACSLSCIRSFSSP